MFPRIKKSIRPKRKQDYSFPDGTLPEPKQWIAGGRISPASRWVSNYFGRWDRARLGEEIAEWEKEGKLVYTPRIHYTIEIRKSERIDGKPTPKTIKTWFLKSSVSNRTGFYRRISADLLKRGVTSSEVLRIQEKIESAISI